MKTTPEQKLITKQVSRKLEELKALQSLARGVPSWINYVRMGLGMSLTQLAARVGVAQPSLSSSIKLEQEGRITIHKLKEIAEAMDCDLVYGFVPRKKIEDIIRDQAVKKTKSLMQEAETHMTLEDQQVTRSQDERMKELVEERMYSKYLWDK